MSVAIQFTSHVFPPSSENACSRMTRFDRFLLGKERLRPAAALRRARLELSRTRHWGSPFYWAGFQLQGDWN